MASREIVISPSGKSVVSIVFSKADSERVYLILVSFSSVMVSVNVFKFFSETFPLTVTVPLIFFSETLPLSSSFFSATGSTFVITGTGSALSR